MWNHWTFRSNHPHNPFQDFESARSVWVQLPGLFPDALMAVLMPNHLHLILPRSEKTYSKLVGVMGSISKKHGIPALWQPIPPTKEILDLKHLRRQLRYVALNPCRNNLARDPLEWVWSTYRDGVGASAKPWVKTAHIAQVLKEAERGFSVRFHDYVSGDPSVAVEGTSYPKAHVKSVYASESIVNILSAAAATLRAPASEVRQRRSELRQLFVHFAWQQGWIQTKLLSQICDTSTRAIHQILEKPEPPGMNAALMCLGDVRLRRDVNFQLRVDVRQKTDNQLASSNIMNPFHDDE